MSSGQLLRAVWRSGGGGVWRSGGGGGVWRGSLKLGALGVCASLAGYHVILRPAAHRHTAQCKHTPTLILRSTFKSHDKELRFDWWMLWDAVSPDLLLLSVAVIVSHNMSSRMILMCHK